MEQGRLRRESYWVVRCVRRDENVIDLPARRIFPCSLAAFAMATFSAQRLSVPAGCFTAGPFSCVGSVMSGPSVSHEDPLSSSTYSSAVLCPSLRAD